MKKVMTGIAGLALFIGVTGSGLAQIQNGGFESTTFGNGQLGYNTDATHWTISGGYTFLFAPGTADTTGAVGQYGGIKLWGPGTGSANGLTSSPDGGNFIAGDGAFQVAPIKQTLTGLTIGQNYNVSFYWAAAQQSGYTGATTDQWQVTFGGAPAQSTSVYNLPSHGFSGWQSASMDFTADGTSDVLSFLAVGTPAGLPPFALLDGVKVTATPEPGAYALLASLGLTGVAFLRRRRAAKSGK